MNERPSIVVSAVVEAIVSVVFVGALFAIMTETPARARRHAAILRRYAYRMTGEETRDWRTGARATFARRMRADMIASEFMEPIVEQDCGCSDG